MGNSMTFGRSMEGWRCGIRRNDAAMREQVQRLGGTLEQLRELLQTPRQETRRTRDIEHFLRNLDTKSVPAVAERVQELARLVADIVKSEREQIDAL